MTDVHPVRVREPEGGEGPALRSVPAAPSVEAQSRSGGGLEGAPARSAARPRPAVEAWAKIAAPLASGLGIRVIFLGVTGKGKTTGARHFLSYVRDRHLVDLVLVHDVKLPRIQYDGEVVHEARDIYTEPPAGYPAQRVLRKRGLDHTPSVEGLGRVTLEAGNDGIRTMAVIDELQRALTDGGKQFSAPSVRRVFCEGLGLSASILATKQLPQNIPTEATAQSTIVYFGTNVEGVNFLVDERKVSRAHGELLAQLEVGQFTFVPQEGNYDGHVYVVPPP